MRVEDICLLRDLLRARSGLVLSDDKAYLLESRLGPVARRRGMAGLDELFAAIRTCPDEGILADITEAMLTNETSFFRDGRPFEQFRDLMVPRLLQPTARTRRIRIWSAACSTGQEPYSIAMLLADSAAALAGWTVEILGTDLSAGALEKARSGVYSRFDVQRSLPNPCLSRYLQPRGDDWEVVPEIRRRVTFRQFNLLSDLAPLGRFDVVFCRNVLIYFDLATKIRILDAIANLLAPYGVLYLGGAETVIGLTARFRPVEGQRSAYELAVPSLEPARAAPPIGAMPREIA